MVNRRGKIEVFGGMAAFAILSALVPYFEIELLTKVLPPSMGICYYITVYYRGIAGKYDKN